MARAYVLLALVGFVVSSAYSEPENAHARYAGQKLISVYAKNGRQVEILMELQSDDNLLLDFFNVPAMNRNTTIRIPKHAMKKVKTLLKSADIKQEIISENVQEFADEGMRKFREMEERTRSLKLSSVIRTRYLWFDEIMTYMDDLEKLGTGRIRVSTFGHSHENLKLVKVHLSTTFTANKRAVWVECLTHAREWITGAVCVNIIDTLVRQYGQDPRVTYMMDKFDWIFAPVANPDGYHFSLESDRLWRKNRKHVSNNCMGVDLNRNWEIAFGGEGSSSRCSSESYKGTGPLSEPETKALDDAVKQTMVEQGVVAFLAMHSYGQMILVPYGYTFDAPPDQEHMLEVARHAGNRIYEATSRNYLVGVSGALLYLAGGCSDDHFKERHGLAYSYTYELRPEGYNPGFVLPADEIDGTYQETFASFFGLAERMI